LGHGHRHPDLQDGRNFLLIVASALGTKTVPAMGFAL
jgi:hypothetical protein